MTDRSREQKAALFVLSSCLLEAFVPVIAYTASRAFPPVFFLAMSSGIAATVLGLFLGVKGDLHTLPSAKNLLLCLVVAVLIVVVPFTLIFVGARYTTSVNTAILLQAEVLTTFFVYRLLFHERHTHVQMLGAALMLAGTVTILFRGLFVLNRGDVLILLATTILPFGNYFAKKVLQELSPSQVVFYRYVFAFFILLPLSLLLESVSIAPLFTPRSLALLLSFSIFIHVFSKVLWYRGFRFIPVSRSIAILSVTPAFSLLLAFVLLHEVPTLYQWIGFAFTMIGLGVLFQGQKEPQQLPTLR